MLNFFHISDLHYTAREGQLRDTARAAVKGMLRLASELQERGVLGGDVKVCVTGDIVQSGSTKADFDAVQADLFEPLMEILSISPRDVFIVPGNHELDRDAIPEDERLVQGQYAGNKVCEADLVRDLRSKLANFYSFIEQYGYQSLTASEPRMRTFNLDGQQVVCFNGLIGSYSREGYGDKGELFALASEYGNKFSEIQPNAIVLTHHPLSWFADNCATDLKEFFSQRQVRLLTGHIHDLGIDWIETQRGGFAIIQAGATAEVGADNQVAVGWFPHSNSVAVRHYEFDRRAAHFPLVSSDQTKVAPSKAEDFFRNSPAFFDPAIIEAATEKAQLECDADLKAASAKDFADFVPPDIAFVPQDQFNHRRVSAEDLLQDSKNCLISGEELSGKSSLLHYLASLFQRQAQGAKIAVVLDFRTLEAGHSLAELLLKRMLTFGLTRKQTPYLLEIGRVELFLDNFAPDAVQAMRDFMAFAEKYPVVRWTVATRGDGRYMPSRAPAALGNANVSYYQLTETTLPTVLKMIGQHGNGGDLARPRAVVEQVFRSINNLRAPRTIFYVNSLVDVFLSDGSVEPLNRYLLIENLLSDRIRAAHREELPGEPVDMEMLETLIGQIAFRLMERSEPYLKKADYYNLVDNFIDRKGIQRKRFNPDRVLNILLKSFVLRDYEFGYGFMMLSIEDYFLAKHMGRDSEFRSQMMSPEGLLTYPSVAEFYIAQNPSDEPRIEEVLAIIEAFEQEVRPVVSEIRESSIDAFKTAHPGGGLEIREKLVDMLAKIDGSEEPTTLNFQDPKRVGRTKRMQFSEEERGAVFLQLGASILGVTRTLDQEDRVKIFKRLRGVLLTSLHSMPMIAQHLADGNEIRFRGTTIKADYVGDLAVSENRFYIILRGMVFNLLRNFATWAGSPSFFNAAVKLRQEESDEFICSALFAQNIEADLTEALKFIPEILEGTESLILKEILVHLYLHSLTLIPIERTDVEKAVDKLVDVTFELSPPKSSGNRSLSERHRDKLRRNYNDRIGYNAYIGRIVKGRVTPRRKKD